MNPEIARRLNPYQDAVTAAQAALDQANRSTDVADTYAPAGALIKAHKNLTAVCVDLLECLPPHDADGWERVMLEVHGQINRRDAPESWGT